MSETFTFLRLRRCKRQNATLVYSPARGEIPRTGRRESLLMREKRYEWTKFVKNLQIRPFFWRELLTFLAKWFILMGAKKFI